MKVNISINLNIEAPDSTGMIGDATILLENIIYVLKPFEGQIADHYDEWKPTETIEGTVDISPTHESTGRYTIIRVPEIEEIPEPKINQGLIPKSCTIMESLHWALETTLEDIVYAESYIKWHEEQKQSTDSGKKWLDRATKRYQKLHTAWERRTNEML